MLNLIGNTPRSTRLDRDLVRKGAREERERYVEKFINTAQAAGAVLIALEVQPKIEARGVFRVASGLRIVGRTSKKEHVRLEGWPLGYASKIRGRDCDNGRLLLLTTGNEIVSLEIERGDGTTSLPLGDTALPGGTVRLVRPDGYPGSENRPLTYNDLVPFVGDAVRIPFMNTVPLEALDDFTSQLPGGIKVDLSGQN